MEGDGLYFFSGGEGIEENLGADCDKLKSLVLKLKFKVN